MPFANVNGIAAAYETSGQWIMLSSTSSAATTINDWWTNGWHDTTTSGTDTAITGWASNYRAVRPYTNAEVTEGARAWREQQAIAQRNYEQLNQQAAWVEGQPEPQVTRLPRDHPAYVMRLEREMKEADAVKKRAERLLHSMLSKEQKEQLEKLRYFDVIAGQSKRRYRVHYGTHGNVRLMDGDREVVSYCAQPDNVPTEDAMLSQKLAIEHDEEAWLQVANGTDLATGRRVRRAA